MSSFLQKLKGEGVVKKTEEVKTSQPATSNTGAVAKIDLDVFQTGTEVVIYAVIPGSREEDIEILIEGDNDVITIRGIKNRPAGVFGEGHLEDIGQYIVEECLWGEFYRQIILPDKIDIKISEARYSNGVLVVKLPLLVASNNKTRLKVSRVDGTASQATS